MTECDPKRRDRERIRKKKRRRDVCSRKDCKTRLNSVNRMKCAQCGRDFCVKHRLPSNHECRRRSSAASVTRRATTNRTERATERGEVCPQCSARFATVDLLVAHVVAIHEKEESSSSTVCGSEICPVRSLRVHSFALVSSSHSASTRHRKRTAMRVSLWIDRSSCRTCRTRALVRTRDTGSPAPKAPKR